MTEAERSAKLEAIIRASPTLMRVLTLARDLALPDWRIVAGALYQTLWNQLSGREPDYGIKDYDLVYFDPDTSWDAEDAAIRRAAAHFPPPLSPLVEVRNQSRVHLWFEQKFGELYAPLTCTDEMIERFVCPAFSIGARLAPDGGLSIVAPFGLEDAFALRLRPNPRRPANPDGFARVAANCRSRWPEVEVMGPDTFSTTDRPASKLRLKADAEKMAPRMRRLTLSFASFKRIGAMNNAPVDRRRLRRRAVQGQPRLRGRAAERLAGRRLDAGAGAGE